MERRLAGGSQTMSRRERRREETIEEILDLSLEVMRQEGVARLNLTAVAKRLGVQTTTLYKYFPSLVGVYDALFHRAMDGLYEVFSAAMSAAPPGMASVRAALYASTRWWVENPELAQLLVCRAVPGYVAPPDALVPGKAALGMLVHALDDAAARGEIGPDGGGMRGAHILGVLWTGAATLHFADFGNWWAAVDELNELPTQLVDMFVRAFPPATQNLTT